LDVSKAMDEAAGAEREVISEAWRGERAGRSAGIMVDAVPRIVVVTAPATDLARKWKGWGTALKPAHEPIVVARKPLIGTVAENVLTYGTGGLNIDGTRVGIAPGDEPSAGHRTATFGNQDTTSGGDGSGGWTASSGRWPANVIHDGNDEVVELFPNTKSGVITPYVENPQSPTSFNFAGRVKPGFDYGDSGSAARFFYCAKASKKDRNEGLDGFEAKRASGYGYDHGLGKAAEGMFKDRNPIKQNYHPTVKPTDLMRYLCRLVTPPNGIILDPFMGSGSTGKAAILEGFRFIGIEMTDEYLPIAKARIEWATTQGDDDLFGGAV